MPKEKPRNIHKSVTCFNKILRLFGLGLPFNVETGKTQVNLGNRIGFLVNISCSIFAMAIALSEAEFEALTGSPIVRAGWHYQYQLQVVLVLPLMIFNYIKRKHVEAFFSKVRKFDELMANTAWMKHKPKRSWTSRYLKTGLVVSSILFLLVFHFAIIFLEAYLRPLAVVRTSVFLLVTEFYVLISFQFIFGTLCIYRRFRALNMNVR